MKIVFWQNIPSMHQSALIRNLAAHKDLHVCLVTEEDVPDRRLQMGWSRPDFGRTELFIAPAAAEVNRLLLDDQDRAVHIFSGIRGYPFVRRAFLQACKTSALLGFSAEIPRPDGLKGFLRRIIYTENAYRHRGRIDFILAIGRNCLSWFISCGYPASLMYPFAYCVEAPLQHSGDTQRHPAGQDEFHLIFIGALASWKGVDVLLNALARLGDNPPWRLSLIGDGPERESLARLAGRLGLGSRVRFLGRQANHRAMATLADADLLVLPSRYDGWGAVVSEALLRGVPVVCSDRCGASVLIENMPTRGKVFCSGSVDSLAKALMACVACGKRTDAERAGLKNWANDSLSGEAAAGYLLRIIDHAGGAGNRPLPPWQAN